MPKKSKSKADIAVVEKVKTKTLELPVFSFHTLHDYHLARLIRDHFDDLNLSLAQLSLLCGWEDKEFELCFDCLKSKKLPLKVGNETDFITYMVHKDILPEGNYLVVVGQE